MVYDDDDDEEEEEEPEMLAIKEEEKELEGQEIKKGGAAHLWLHQSDQ